MLISAVVNPCIFRQFGLRLIDSNRKQFVYQQKRLDNVSNRMIFEKILFIILLLIENMRSNSKQIFEAEFLLPKCVSSIARN